MFAIVLAVVAAVRLPIMVRVALRTARRIGLRRRQRHGKRRERRCEDEYTHRTNLLGRFSPPCQQGGDRIYCAAKLLACWPTRVTSTRGFGRPEEGRVGKECVSTGSYRCGRSPEK